jgi:hypothetical protein
MDSIMAGENLGIFVREIRIGIGRAGHPVPPSSSSETLAYVRDIGMTRLPRAFRGLQIKKNRMVSWRLIRQPAIGSISKAWQLGGRLLPEPVFDFFYGNSGRKIVADKQEQETR